MDNVKCHCHSDEQYCETRQYTDPETGETYFAWAVFTDRSFPDDPGETCEIGLYDVQFCPWCGAECVRETGAVRAHTSDED